MIRYCHWSLLVLCVTAATAPAQDAAAFAIRGRVVDAVGKPVAGAMVRLFAQGFEGFDVDEQTATDAEGRFGVQAPKSWTRMNQNRQELALLATKGGRIAIVRFDRSSAPPTSEVELVLANVSGAKIAIFGPDQRPIAGAKVKIAGIVSDTIHVGLTEERVRQMGKNVKKTAVGYVTGSETVDLPPDLRMDIGSTDAEGLVTAANLTADRIGAVIIQTVEFGEQTVGHYSFLGAKASDWPNRIVLKRPGRIVGQLASPVAESIARREVTLRSFEQDKPSGIYHSGEANVVTASDGTFDVKMVPGAVRYGVKFDANLPTRPAQDADARQLKPEATLTLKIELKPAIRVESEVLDAVTKEPIRGIQVRTYVGMGFESTTSDAQGKFGFWMLPGESAFHPDIPEGYLSMLAPSDYFDPNKRQQDVTIFKVPEGKRFAAPPILLRTPVDLKGIVLDEQGRPLPGADISGILLSFDRRTSTPKSHDVVAKANERGEFTLGGIDPRETMRLRVAAQIGSKILTIAKPGSETVRVVIAPNERFRISGRVADAEGKPYAEAILEIWHRDWRPAPDIAEPTKLTFKEPIRTDAMGDFRTTPLLPDGYYRLTIRASGARTTQSGWLDATAAEATAAQAIVIPRLRGVSGLVRDREGKPIVDAQISLFTRESRTETTSNAAGEFQLEIPAGKPFSVIVRHVDFRVTGTCYDKSPANLNQTMIRLTEPDENLALRPILSKEERETILKRLFAPLKDRLAKSTNTQEKVGALQSLTGVAPDFVMDFLDKNPLKPPFYTEMLLTQVAMKRAARNAEEAEELIGRLPPGSQKSLSYAKLVDALPESARAKKLEILAEVLVGARAEKSPEFRAIVLGQAAKRLFELGEKERATTLLREGEKVAKGLSSSAFAGYARGCFATDLALIDLPAALALMKDLKDRNEFQRHHGNTAHRLAGINPKEAIRVLDLIPPPGPNEFNQRDHYAIRACYRMAQADLKSALQLAGSIGDLSSRAYALGVIGHGLGKTDRKQASELLRRAFALLEEEAARPDAPQLTSPLLPGSVAAALTLAAEQIDPTMVRECLWRSVALQRQHTEDQNQIWRYATGNCALAMVAGRYDARLGESLLPDGKDVSRYRESQLARFLADPRRTVAATEKASASQDDRDLLQMINYLSTEEHRVPQLILSTLGIWRPDVEDIGF